MANNASSSLHVTDTQSAPDTAAARGTSAPLQMKSALAGKALDVQTKMLTPGAVQRKGNGAPPQKHNGDAAAMPEEARAEKPVQKRGVHRDAKDVQLKASDDVQRTPTAVDASHVRGPADAQVNLTGTSMAAPSTDNPNFESDATSFEAALGGLAMTRGSAAASAMCSRALTYMKSKAAATATAVADTKQKLDELLTACGTASASFAGAVGTDPRTIEFIASSVRERVAVVAEAEAAGKAIVDYQTPPNVREQMTFLYNFGKEIIGKDLISDGAAAVSARLGATAEEKAKLEAKVAEITQLAAERAAGAAAGSRDANPAASVGDAVWGVPGRGAPVAPGAEGPSGPMGTAGAISGDNGGAAPAGADTDRAVRGQGEARVHRTAVNDAVDPSRTAAPGSRDRAPTEARQAADMPQTYSSRTNADLAPGAATSGRENATMGIAPTDVLKWSEGDKMWFINEKDKWVQAVRSVGLPLGGGPSGTTTAIMNTNELISGGSAVDARLAAIGYLLPIHAHTLVEIMAAASAFGAPFTAGRQMYKSILPFSDGDLRNLGRTNPQAGSDPEGRTKLFPHEPTPPPPAPAAVSGGATDSGTGATPAAAAPAAAPPAAG